MKVLISRLSVVLRADKLVGLNGARSSSKNAKAGSVVPMRSARIDETREVQLINRLDVKFGDDADP
jgi:hypothetical protein